MAISKVTRAALTLLSYLEPGVKKTYPIDRQIKKLLGVGSRVLVPTDIRNTFVFNGDYTVGVRVFVPHSRIKGNLLFFHGGGWVTGDLDSYSHVCANLAKYTQHAVIAVDYRLAPEHRFPLAVEDCYAVAREIFRKEGTHGVKPKRVTLIGDSAGGNIAAAVSLMARDRGEFLPKRQILIYPATNNDHSPSSPFESVRANGTGYLLKSKSVNDYMELYRGSEKDLSNPYFAPLLAKDFSNQPRTLIITAEYCPLRDEGEEYGQRLSAAGVDVETHRIKDALHGYFSLPPQFEQVRKTYDLINRFIEKDEVKLNADGTMA